MSTLHLAYYVVSYMVDWNRDRCDSSLFHAWVLAVQVGDDVAKRVYDFALKNEMKDDFYIGDGQGTSWKDDWFIIPNWTAKECEDLRQYIVRRYQHDRT